MVVPTEPPISSVIMMSHGDQLFNVKLYHHQSEVPAKLLSSGYLPGVLGYIVKILLDPVVASHFVNAIRKQLFVTSAQVLVIATKNLCIICEGEAAKEL
jgi:hypothetical protein